MIFASKYHGCGNDFLIVACDQVPATRLSELAKSICDPHFGIGADGCVFVGPQAERFFAIRIFNRDGGEAEMSGNGARCAAAYIHHRKLSREAELMLATAAGPRCYLLLSSDSLRWQYRSSMGSPSFDPAAIPFLWGECREVVDCEVALETERIRISPLNVGNPQCVVFVQENFSDADFQRLGARLAVDARFPAGTNVSFVQLISRRQIRIRIWERGVGPTLSSGTGSCGAGVAAIRSGRADSPLEVITEGGSQLVEWSEGREIQLTGAAEFIGDIHYHWRSR